MSRYLVAPYLFQVQARGTQSAPALPIENIDGNGAQLQDAVGKILTALIAKQELKDHNDINKTYEIRSLEIGSGSAFLLTIAPGRRGLESEIVTPAGHKTDRSASDAEFIPLRHLIVFPPSSYSALVFAERFGRYGVISFLRTCIYQTLRERFGALTTHIDPLTTLEALKHASYKKITYRTPNNRDSAGKLIDFGTSIDIELAVKKPRRVDALTTANGKVSRDKVFGVLRDEAKASGLQTPQAAAGWDVSLTVELATGGTRTFDIEDSGPALVYPLSGALLPNGTQVANSTRPDDDDFLALCNVILKDIDGQYSVTLTTRVGPANAFTAWRSSGSDPWEVRYYDSP